jgi:putative DNA primase/helicase
MGFAPVWSLINTGGIAAFPLIQRVGGIHLFRENDLNGASWRAVKTCAQRWFAAGRTGKIVIPEIGKDLNAELRAAGR